MNRTTLHTVTGSFVALLIGAAAARLPTHFPGEGNKTASAQERAAASSNTSATPNPSSAVKRETATSARDVEESLARSFRGETGARRWLVLLSAAENARAEDMPGLIRMAGTDSATVRMLGARWAELDPKHMFISLCADYLLPEDAPGGLPSRWILSDVLFEQWTKTDLAGAIKALNDAPNFGGRESLRMTVANQVMKTDVEEGLRVMKEWNIRNYIPDMKMVGEWAARDPQHAAEAVMKLGSDYAALEALKQVGKAWAQTDPEAGLRFAASLDATSRAALATEVMRAWAEKNVASAAAFAAGQPDMSFRSALAQGLVSAWGKTDPAAALAWSQENLRGAARTEAIAGLVKAAAEKSLTSASQLVADMEPGPAQNRACASIFETWFNKGKGERDAAFEWLASLPDAEARRAALERVQWNWMWNDPIGVRDFLNGPYGNLASPSMIQQVARNQAARNPEAAMEWASNLPADRAADARNAVLENWLSVRPEGAAAYARKLPAGPERDHAIRTVSQNLIFQSPEQAADWFRTLPAAEQKTAREVFDHTGLSDDQRRQLEQALKKR
jgi:hypothetical protein